MRPITKDQLADCIGSKFTAKMVGRQFKCSPNQVYNAARYYGLRFQPANQSNCILSAIKQGANTARKISACTGYKRANVTTALSYLKKKGLVECLGRRADAEGHRAIHWRVVTPSHGHLEAAE